MKIVSKAYSGSVTVASTSVSTYKDTNGLSIYYYPELAKVLLDCVEDFLTENEVPFTMDKDNYTLTVFDETIKIILGSNYSSSSSYALGAIMRYPISGCAYTNTSSSNTLGFIINSSMKKGSYGFILDLYYTKNICIVKIRTSSSASTSKYTLANFLRGRLLYNNRDITVIGAWSSLYVNNNNSAMCSMSPSSLTTSYTSVFKGDDDNYYVAPYKFGFERSSTYNGYASDYTPVVPAIDTYGYIHYYDMYMTKQGILSPYSYYEINGETYFAIADNLLIKDSTT